MSLLPPATPYGHSANKWSKCTRFCLLSAHPGPVRKLEDLRGCDNIAFAQSGRSWLCKPQASICRTRIYASQSIQSFGEGSLQPQRGSRSVPSKALAYNGVFALLLLNFIVFFADKALKLPSIAALYLHHSQPHWWQYLTAAFCHASWQHISGNAFMLLIFGRIVEEEEGTFGVLATYIFCALGSSIASYLLQPRQVVSLGASGAVFGLFVVSVLCKLSLNPRKLLECAILGQFVLQQVLHEAKMQIGSRGTAIAGTRVGHLAHLFGALAGVLLVFLLSKVPAPDDK